ncbi:MAG: hypothetical protein KDB22_00225 [Planctomycetales bacterium]|nr:hypothetical protein [Planctomycetales bacterium]
MLTPDADGRVWNAGLKIGIIYGVIAGILYAVLDYALHNMDAPERWLPLIAGFLILAPVAAASHAYSVGQRSQTKVKPL